MIKSFFAGHFASLILAVLALAFPEIAFAMGGEGMVGGILAIILGAVVWLIVTIFSFFIRTESRTFPRYFIWLIRLSFPLWLIWVVIDAQYIEPAMSMARYKKNMMIAESKKLEFRDLCEKHVSAATQIFHISKDPRPKSIYINQPNPIFEPDISLNLTNCIANKTTSSCKDIGFEFIEWTKLHQSGQSFDPCKNGVNPKNVYQCLPEYKRSDLGEGGFKTTDIEKPTSDYIVHVKEDRQGKKSASKGIDIYEIRKYLVTLESGKTEEIFAKTEILVGHEGKEKACPRPENEVAKMITQVFPNR